jgi:beta-galactosidase
VTDNDGQEIQSGVLPALNCAPGASENVKIPVKKISRPKPGSEFWLRVSWHTRTDNLWSQAGYEIAWQQMRLFVKAPPLRETRRSKGLLLEITKDDDLVTISGNYFSVGFSSSAGTLVSLNYGDRELLAPSTNNLSGPVLQFYRAPTDNDKGFGHWLAADWQDAGLERAKRKVDSFRVTKLPSGEVQVQAFATTSVTNGGYKLQTVWTIHGDGSLDMDNKFQPFGQLPETLPRIGIVIKLAAPFENFRWYGRGPWENYADRKQSADMGVWTSAVSDQYVPYVRPQENGNKEDVRWLTLTDANGGGLMVKDEGDPMAVSALHFTAADLAAVRHSYELKPRPEVILSLDARQCGLGNSSCGPGVLVPYSVPPTNYSLKLELSPVTPK